MPHDNIERAVKKGSGAGSDVETYHHLTYEGYGPSGVAVYVTALTDNKNRTAADIRYIFDRVGGKLGTEAGAEDVLAEGDAFEIRCEAADFMAVRKNLEEAGISYTSAELTMIPKNTVAVDEADARKTLRLLDALEDNDDVQEVYANFDVTDDVMESLAG